MTTRHKLTLLFFLLFIAVPLAVNGQSGLETRYSEIVRPFTDNIRGGETVTINAGEVINDNFVRFAEKIIINGDITGDVIVGAFELTINGNVAGDVIAGAESIEINGDVTGSVRVAGQDIIIRGSVGRNVNVFGGTVELDSSASVAMSATFFAGDIKINCPIGGSIYGFGGTVTLNNTVGTNVTLLLDDTGYATLKPNTAINGNLTHHGNGNISIQSGAVIKGETIHKQIPLEILEARDFLSNSWIYIKIIGLFGALLVGTLIISIFEKTSTRHAEEMWRQPISKLLWGLLILVGSPIAITIIAITIIGLPLAFIGAALYAFLLYIAKVFVGLAIGYKLLNRGGKKVALVWSMILGVIIYTVVVNIPVIGGLLTFTGAVWFLGTTGHLLVKLRKQKKTNSKLTNNNKK